MTSFSGVPDCSVLALIRKYQFAATAPARSFWWPGDPQLSHPTLIRETVGSGSDAPSVHSDAH
ncbi:hypothetical protein AURDEDRAFT_178446 [Auricularia subglabra TFB-10046 SS5]|uniref:Uncharacterized protein n=1 Tax=Auricularia subglabra (strain TFB-10046 / SS5) TaxID=717982 RepID=J0CQK5_AURST|nr:hypothetical protein AURDEDRAFT_178446 [Auricularia subglabra TFB-10046 SS5]